MFVLNGHRKSEGLVGEKDYSQNRLLRGFAELGDVLVVQAQQVEDIGETLAINASGGFELDLGLGAPGDTQACCVKHEEIVSSVAD